jgi:hypothetical protein
LALYNQPEPRHFKPQKTNQEISAGFCDRELLANPFCIFKQPLLGSNRRRALKLVWFELSAYQNSEYVKKTFSSMSVYEIVMKNVWRQCVCMSAASGLIRDSGTHMATGSGNSCTLGIFKK